MGKFLKELRKSKNLTMNDLIEELNKEYLGVTIKTISDWENGNTIPELEKLVYLARFYNVSIDEILNGERLITIKELEKMYSFFDREVYEFNAKEKDEWAKNRIINTRKINNRFKELLKKYYRNEMSINEDMELDFVFKIKCQLNEYFDKCYTKKSSDEFIDFKRAMRDLRKNPQVKNEDEFYWEIQKYFDAKSKYKTTVEFSDIADEEVLHNNNFLSLLLSQSEPWEMDMLVAGFQNFEPIIINTDSSSNRMKRYEEHYGKKFDREAIYKSTLKYLLEHGGMLNPFFFNFNEKKIRKLNLIDRLENLYKICLRPLEIFTIDEERPEFTKRYFIDNSPYNRFLNSYYSFRNIISFTGEKEIDVDTIFPLVTNDPDSEKVINLLCKNKNIDLSKDKESIISDLSFDIKRWENAKKKYLDKEEEIKKCLEEIKLLKKLLENGETIYQETYVEKIGPQKMEELREYINLWKSNLSLKNFNNERDRKRTKELLNEIDFLSVKEIREKYFPIVTFEEASNNE